MIYNYRSLVLGVYLLLNICFNSYCSSPIDTNQTNIHTTSPTQTTPPTQYSQQNCIKSFIKENIDFILHKVFCKKHSPEGIKIYNIRNIKRWYDLYLNHYDDIYIRKYRFLDFLYRYLNIIHMGQDEMIITREIHTLTSFIFQAFLYRGLGGTKQFSSKYNFIGCDWYFGIGNVPYVGGFLTLAFVCKPTFIFKYLPPFLHDKVTIHIIDFKPLYYILSFLFYKYYDGFVYYTKDFKDTIIKDFKGKININCLYGSLFRTVKNYHMWRMYPIVCELYTRGFISLEIKICAFMQASINILGFSTLFLQNCYNILLLLLGIWENKKYLDDKDVFERNKHYADIMDDMFKYGQLQL